MNIVIDIFLVLVFACAIYDGWSKGLVKSVMNLVRWGVSLLAAVILGPLLALWIGFSILGCIVVVFGVTFLIMTLISLAAKKLAELPVLKTMDKILGLIVGIFTGVVNVIFLSTVLNVISAVFHIRALENGTFFLRLFEGVSDLVFK